MDGLGCPQLWCLACPLHNLLPPASCSGLIREVLEKGQEQDLGVSPGPLLPFALDHPNSRPALLRARQSLVNVL